MGKTVGEKSPEFSRVFSTDFMMNLEHLNSKYLVAASCGKNLTKNCTENNFTGVQIAWIEEKSNKNWIPTLIRLRLRRKFKLG